MKKKKDPYAFTGTFVWGNGFPAQEKLDEMVERAFGCLGFKKDDKVQKNIKKAKADTGS